MAGNNAIQFFRGDSSTKKSEVGAKTILLPGQPFYEIDTNKLYIGDGIKTLDKLYSITDNLNNDLNRKFENLLKNFWLGVIQGNTAVKVGDRSFISFDGVWLLPVLCVDTYKVSSDPRGVQRNSIWQFNWNVRYKAIDKSKDIAKWKEGNKWENTIIYRTLNDDNGDIMGSFPSYISDNIVPVRKSMGTITIRKYTGSANTYSDPGTQSKLWIPAAQEIYGSGNTHFPIYTWKENQVEKSESDISSQFGEKQFEYYKQLLGENAAPPSGRDDVPNILASSTDIWLRNYTMGRDEEFTPYIYQLTSKGGLYADGNNYETALTICFVLGQKT